MSNSHRIPYDLHNADLTIEDPGDGKTIVVDRLPGVVRLSLASAIETRTLANPTRPGQVVTITNPANTCYLAYNSATETMILDRADETVVLQAISDSAWKVIIGPGSESTPVVEGFGSLTAITAADIDTDSDVKFGVSDDGAARSLSLAELKKTGVQAVNVRQYGATVDGIADDTAEVQAALTAAGDDYVVVIDGPCYVSDTITMPAGSHLVGVGSNAKIVVANLWANKPVLALSSSGAKVSNLSIEETSASATADKSGNANTGIAVTASDCEVRKCDVLGFNFGIVVRNADRALISDCNCSLAYSWGIEIDGSQDVRMESCTSHTNGWHGCKVQNEDVARSCDGLVIDKYLAYNNGRRTTGAGGSDGVNNGVGLSLYNGGYRYILSNSICHSNYGSGFSQKGGAGDEIQGEGTISNCQFYGNLTGAAAGHGMEFGIGGGLGSYNIHVTNVNSSNNTGCGFFVGGGIGITISNCTANNNTDCGALFYSAYDCTLSDTNLLANGSMGVRVGFSQAASHVSRRITLSKCVISGNWDYELAVDPKSASTTKNSEYGILVYSDTADTTIVGCRVYNINTNDQSIAVYGNRTTIKDTNVYNALRTAYYLAATGIVFENCKAIDVDFSSATYNGAVTVASGAVVYAKNIAGVQSSLTSQSRVFLSLGTLYAEHTTISNLTYKYILDGSGRAYIRESGTGAPSLVCSTGSTYSREDGGASTALYVKESATGSTNWVAK